MKNQIALIEQVTQKLNNFRYVRPDWKLSEY
jgi:hypothetical protein